MEKRLTFPFEKWSEDERRLESGIKLFVDSEKKLKEDEENVENKKKRGKPDLLAHRRKSKKKRNGREAQVFYLC